VTTLGYLREAIDKQEDGPIDRDRLAKLLNLERQTLKNKARDLPEPIKRGPKDVPIYKYSQVKAALAEIFPDRAHLLPSYREAIERTN
jgi:hypothetical protein